MKYKKFVIFIISLVLIILIATMIFILTNKPEKILSENGNSENDNLNNEFALENSPIEGTGISSVHRFIDNIEFGIGDSAEEIVEKWGTPLEVDYIYGGLYLKYEDVVFYTDGYINEDKTYFYGNIGTIEAKESYGIKAGMNIYESRAVLGPQDGMSIFDELREYGEGIVYPTDFYYRDDYTISIPYDPDTKFVHYVRLGTYRESPDILGSGFLELTDNEKNIYEDYILDFDENKINGCTPITIMKFWLHALQGNDYETEWKLYTKDEDQLGWDKEYHMNLRADQRIRDFDVYKNPINIEVNYDENYKYAYISWEDKYLEEYDGFGNPFRFSFSIVNARDRIWKVAFTPMQ